MIRQSIHQEDVNVSAPNNRVSKYKQKLTKLKGEIDKSAIIVGDVTIPLSTAAELVGRKSTRI